VPANAPRVSGPADIGQLGENCSVRRRQTLPKSPAMRADRVTG
jgi:hypothetical protein